MQVVRIFTDKSISPSLSPRQRPDRYAFRAGRNLPDKEFRYLRTVRVTAAVHWGFSSRLAAIPLTFQHWAGLSPYTSPFSLAETCVFDKQLPGSFHCDLSRLCAACARQLKQALFLPKLQSNFAEFLNENYLAHLRILILSTCVGLWYG